VFFLRDNHTKTVNWDVEGQKPQGQPLVLNAYKGEVLLVSARVHYEGLPTPTEEKEEPEVKPTTGETQEAVRSSSEARCQTKRYIRHPRIEIGKVRASGGLFSGKHRIYGSIYGMCVEEVGYFEYGRLKERIEFPLDDKFERKDFEVRIQTGRDGEIRAFTTDGKEERISVDELVTQNPSLF